jgi:hypothetical protein
VLLWSGLFLAGLLIGFGLSWLLPKSVRHDPVQGAASGAALEITLSATIDGSERFIFTRDTAWDDHGRWGPPKDVLFNEVPWEDLSQAPEGWVEMARQLDLTRASIITRKGRDIVALEHTTEGFDLYFADTQMGAGKYSVTVSIPRK